MKYLKIQNAGELDIRLVALMGGSTKTTDRYKIGKFGTGLKYTLAFLFRNNLDFKIFSGENLIDVSLEQETIKEEIFEIICINKNRTSITTKMGLDWTAWMILRELWCNALDEGSEFKEEKNITDEKRAELFVGEVGKTTFFIQINDEIKNVLDNWSDYFIQNEEPMFENENYGIYENNGKLKLYKQGVLIYQHPDVKSIFKYDIKKADINELREFKGSVSYEVLQALSNPNKEVISHFLGGVKKDHYEGSELDYGWFTSFCEIWKSTIGDSKINYYRSSSDESEENIAAKNITGVITLPKKVYKALTKSFEGIGAVGVSDSNEEFHEVKNFFMKEKIDSVLTNLVSCGYEYDFKIKFITGVFDEKTKSGTNKRENKVLISNLCLDIEDFKLACILIEKIEFLKVNDSDLKKHFVEKYVNEILKQQSIEIS